MLIRIYALILMIGTGLLGCGEDDDKDMASVGLKVRANLASADSLALMQLANSHKKSTALTNEIRQSTMIDLE